MELKYDYWTGPFEDVKGSLVRNISQYSISNNAIKIGITTDPERRIQEHRRSNLGWKRMVVKYQTSSVSYINVIEEILINYHWEYVNNEKSIFSQAEFYYLYILIK
ncbi:MAG TPA: GIY-YIG nuclease family protein [Flavobacterium sp.]|uniref:GIY-YIG nuclease family protein n=1 Tax=Flavobacterium sp. TaxID=239 RepID=UPI002C71B9EF|nr:GIY-YIG nuclease family protein [Flavobacterium sp.]HNP32593.1 GIY-YIG nuclease family protein [Flavobacterium sp.]